MVLIERTFLLGVLTGIHLKSPKVTWEPEQGAFDLMVEGADGQRVLIELKIDSVLSRRQILAQLEHKAVTSGGRWFTCSSVRAGSVAARVGANGSGSWARSRDRRSSTGLR
ncbi:hypothetical protein [Nannocystis pusilla]|uniref:hypothetical protein n=1 Tax=Nannocystis pusilla TaxID=889268 RepID=UPI003B7EE8E2